MVTLCMHCVLNLFTLFTKHATFLHWLYPYYHNIDYNTSDSSLLRKSPCAYMSIDTILSSLPL
jgi:hypothetical protein